jgi:spore maturation protein CgeB
VRVTLFCHSLLSDWNHGNAHFLRGVVTELAHRGCEVDVWEPRDAWSVENLVRDHGESALDLARSAYPEVVCRRYDRASLDLDEAVGQSDLVVVHEWSDPELVARLGERRKRPSSRYRLLFHDTHHRAVTRPREMAAYDLSGYDGVLAFGEVLRELYVSRGWARRAWVWHEAADVRVFAPRAGDTGGSLGDLAWIGNWGDDERARELEEFLLGPIGDLRLSATIHGVRYPDAALSRIARSGARFAGWLPNFRVPEVLAGHAVTVHVPRRPYARALPGIPTIRVFEALACGVPLVTAPWDDAEGLFTPGEDFLVAESGDRMRSHLSALLADRAMARSVAERGRRTVLARHTCGHRVDELLAIAASLGVAVGPCSPTQHGPGGSS